MMNINWERWGYGMLVVMIIATMLMLIMVGGCKSWQLKPGTVEIEPDTAKERFVKAVKSLGWLIILSVIGMAVSAFALFNGNKWALSSLIGSGVMMALSLLISRYAEVIAFVTLLCVLGGIGFFIYSVVVKKRVLVDVIKSVEHAKQMVQKSVSSESALLVSSDMGLALNTQKPATQKVVNKVREKLNGGKI